MVLKNWRIDQLYGDFILIGNIYGDPRGERADGTEVVTSRIKSVDFEKMEAITKNSVYSLDTMWRAKSER